MLCDELPDADALSLVLADVEAVRVALDDSDALGDMLVLRVSDALVDVDNEMVALAVEEDEAVAEVLDDRDCDGEPLRDSVSDTVAVTLPL